MPPAVSKPCLGAQMYTCHDFCKDLRGIAESFRKVGKIGYTAVQASGLGPADPKDVAKAAADAGVSIVATHVKWDRLFNDLDRLIDEHKLWQCRHMAIGAVPPEYRTRGGEKRLAKLLAPIADRVTSEGMDFSYHNHNQELIRFDGKTWLEQFFACPDARNIKVEIDTHWIQAGGGNPPDWIRRYPGRQPLLHLKDFVIVINEEDKPIQRFAEIGEGNLDWPAILAAAADAGVEWYLVEEDNCYGRDPFEMLAISYRNLQAMGLR